MIGNTTHYSSLEELQINVAYTKEAGVDILRERKLCGSQDDYCLPHQSGWSGHTEGQKALWQPG